MSGVVIFVGPTLELARARELLDADYRPPVAQGDVYRAAAIPTPGRPMAIGIIDGYFERVPAVWHKEILWAMRQGVHVFGASSMGALRAAELAAFGMHGVGRIFEQFRDGSLIDDDEVTIVHADAQSGYRQLSVAMVDIRATLAAAVQADVSSEQLAAVLLGLGKRLAYPERNYERLLREARDCGLDPNALERLAQWLPAHRRSQKWLDAEQMLREIAVFQAREPAPFRADYTFEHTDAFEQVVRRNRPHASERDPTVVEELRLIPDAYEQARTRALADVLALQLAAERHIEPDAGAYPRAVADFRRSRDLLDAASTDAWLERQQLSREAFGELIKGELRVEAVRALFAADVDDRLSSALRLDSRYEALAKRAAAKARLLEERGLATPELSSLGVTEHELIAWYFKECGRDAPDHSAVLSILRALEYREPYAFLQALAREYLFRQLQDEREAPD